MASKVDGKTVWPDNNLGPLGPRDRRFPLPGSVGVSPEILPSKTPISPEVPKIEPSTLSDRHEAVSSQMMEHAFGTEGDVHECTMPTATDMLECVAFDCPKTLVRDFYELFPVYERRDGAITVITISQKTVNEMSTWSEAVETEREELLKTYIQGACELCAVLQQAGFWADFIDPSCGKPFLGPSTNFSLQETDERYRSLGFHIDDLGCCKVIRHHLWGTHAYVGCLFTNAPMDHPVIMTMKKDYVEPKH
ncbi:hypothetical protein LOTGIDRAFT_202207 [Lottia gigantea]|uniref:Methylmalonic aciduria and homocystinuria type D protein, mitochondrial n=1 Tax=Lottia gigantea TaxID=225164 RepID=V4ANB5_LOTGI|nr:hypothetical protein LOTGIDRAFT_202207 [Lottia gigantea]ESO96270.1 hypothetical protein LOTGIDRAFT_202207 [Lottia gigantea]